MGDKRFEDSPGLFGSSGSGTHGEIRCDLCGTVYHKGADDNEDYDNDGVCEVTFAGLTVVECCFHKIENEVFNRMMDILPWYKNILDKRQIALTKRKAGLEAVFTQED